MTWIAPRDYFIEARLGHIKGTELVRKFGEGLVGTSLVPVTHSGFYRTPTTPVALEVVSDAAADDGGGGVGAHSVEIRGLDSNWDDVSATYDLNGTTPVAVGSWLRVFRWKLVTSGIYAGQANPSHSGVLTLQVSGAGDVWSAIDPTAFGGQSKIGCVSIPRNKRALLMGFHATIASSKLASIHVLKRANANDITTPFAPMASILEFVGVSDRVDLSGRSGISDPIDGPADILTVGSVSQTTGNISVNFEILVMDK